MHGSGVGTLRFLKRDPQGNIEELLSEDGNQDAVWRKLRIYLKEGVVEGSRIVIEARVGDDTGLGEALHVRCLTDVDITDHTGRCLVSEERNKSSNTIVKLVITQSDRVKL